MSAVALETRAAVRQPIDAAKLLDETHDFVRRFCCFPTLHDAVAVTLWTVLAHMAEHFHATPRLSLQSPEPESGKTRVLEVLNLLVPSPMFVFSASSAAIFRMIAAQKITLLFDEIDAVFSHKGKDDQNEDVRALLNAGYKRGATIPRCVGPRHTVVMFPVFACVALAGIGALPDTLQSRSIIIKMRRRGPHDHVEPFRSRLHEEEGHHLRDRLAAWAAEVGLQAGASWPDLPDGVVDRRAEIWEPLIAVADAAGGVWPTMARTACTELCSVASERAVSLGTRLLADLRAIFAAAGNPISLPSEVLLSRLTGEERLGVDADGADSVLDDAPWHELRGRALDARGLARFLKKYDVKPAKVKTEGKSLQGYRFEDLFDAWARYLPPTSAEAEPAEPAESERTSVGSTGSVLPDTWECEAAASDCPL